MSYKTNATSNRDALFGPRSNGTSSTATRSTTNNTVSSTATVGRSVRTATSSISSKSSVSTLSTTSTAGQQKTTSSGRQKKVVMTRTLTGQAKRDKMKEAEELRNKAKKAMTRGIFSRPDPIIAGTYYRRAADLYKQCGENRLERLHRVASADCQRGQDAHATAAMEYTRAAELCIESDDPPSRRRTESHKLYNDASDMWKQAGESGKSGQCLMNAACCLLIGYEDETNRMERKALESFEVAVEAHVPDPRNRFGFMRRTGASAYKGEDADGDLAKSGMVASPFAHETCGTAVTKCVEYGEYKSALYAAGAVTALFENEGIATISLGRSFLNETILLLAMGDVVAADRTFLEHHLQKNSYLSSRECKLAEDLIRAVKSMDREALDAAKLESRAAMANLEPNMRELVLDLKVTGRVTKPSNKGGATKPAPPKAKAKPPTTAAALTEKAKIVTAGVAATAGTTAAMTAAVPPAGELTRSLSKEMDDLMGDLELDDDKDNDGNKAKAEDNEKEEEEEEEESEEELDDDDLDLR